MVQGSDALVVVKKDRLQFYGRTYTLVEIADLVNLPPDDSLEDELAAVRVTIRRAMGQMNDDLELAEFGRLAALVFTGANTVGRLLRTRREISGQAAEEEAEVIVQALVELEREWNLELRKK